MSESATSPTVELTAPITGVMVRIEDVPDPVFAQKMVGDGFSIDPTEGHVVSPVDGDVADIQATAHAVTVRSREGLEILIHVGLDTVGLKGKGFTARVKTGDAVSAGDPLIDVDLDEVATHAKSLLTQVVIANGDDVDTIIPAIGAVTAGTSTAATVTLSHPAADPAASTGTGATDAAGPAAAAAAASAEGAGPSATSEPIRLPNPTGLHARPAAVLVDAAKAFDATISLHRGEDSASAKSIIAIMGLSLAYLDTLTITASGPDAEKAVTALTEAIRGGLGEDVPPLPPEDAAAEPSPIANEPETTGAHAKTPPEPAGAAGPETGADGPLPDLLTGVSASPGLAVGSVRHLAAAAIEVAETAGEPAVEHEKLDGAIEQAQTQLADLQVKLEKESSKDKAAIFEAHQEILHDPELADQASAGIDGGKSAPYAWREAFTGMADMLAGLDNELLAARANDVRDVGNRVLGILTGQTTGPADLPEGTVLVAEELTPSDTAQLDRTKVVGFATTTGGASSHVAIIARSLDIPAVAGVDARALSIAEGTRVVLDGSAGTLQLNQTDAEIEEIAARQQRIAQRRAAEEARQDEPATTTDGHRIQVVGNIGGVKDAKDVRTKGGEGVGLLRSEFLFLKRDTAPSEEEQAKIYADCARALEPGQPLVIRTLDVGGDKPLSYLPIEHEDNPFLGIRGVRVGLERPEILRTQIRAILAAADAGAQLNVMFPMIATIDDWRAAKAIFDDERTKSGVTAEVPVGIMMEVPSVGVMARQFAAEEGCDFFSVGTNDLTSYTLAIDRGHPKLAPQVDPVNPAVLTLIGQAATALHEQGKWLGICGGVASDPQAVPILVGLGVDELSCSIPAIPAVKAAVRGYSLAQCQDLAARAITLGTPGEVRALVPADEH